jgi:hypothetical protein
MLMMSQTFGGTSEKSRACHETVMAFHYQVVYYHRQLDSGKPALKGYYDGKRRDQAGRGSKTGAARGGNGRACGVPH